MKFELQLELTPPQIFFCGYRILQLFCYNVEGAHDIKCCQKYLELKFCWFQRLGSNFTRGSHEKCFIKKDVLQNFAIFRETPVPESLFKLQLYLARGFSCEFCKIDTFGWLLLFYNSCCLYTLQLYIADNFQVVKSQ